MSALARCFVTATIYAGFFILGLGVTAFVIGTGDFSEWGVGGRLSGILAGMATMYFAAIPLEFCDVRKQLLEALDELGSKT